MARLARSRSGVSVAALLAVTVAACSADQADDGGDDSAPVEEAADEVEVEDVDPDPPTEPDTEPEPEEAAEVDEGPPRVALGLAPLELHTPASGGGMRPELAWEDIDGADRYSVTLYAPDGPAYWAWNGEGTSVVVGGIGSPDDEPTDSGPVVRDGMTWDVAAIDADGSLIAQSGERPIAP